MVVGYMQKYPIHKTAKIGGWVLARENTVLGKVAMPFLYCFYMLLWHVVQISYNHFHGDLLEKPIHLMM